MINQKPILVTGSHRSGSTWVGTMLATSPSVGYVQEPFSLNHRPGIFSAKFDYWFREHLTFAKISSSELTVEISTSQL
jgi:LPS sulfotransferase NodH